MPRPASLFLLLCITGACAEMVPEPPVNVEPTAALRAAMLDYTGQSDNPENLRFSGESVEQVIVDSVVGSRLIWQVEFVVADPGGERAPRRWHYAIDARDGSILEVTSEPEPAVRTDGRLDGSRSRYPSWELGGQAPVADFTFAVDLLTVDFTDTSSDDGTIVSWLWDFGDGLVSTEQHPVHVFPFGGTYMTALTVTDDGGASDTRIQMVRTNAPPTASFTYSTDSLQADFTDGSSDEGAIVQWLWDFGDGSTATVQNPSHTYPVRGMYSVQLTVTDDLGATATAVQVVEVDERPVADFDFEVTGLTVTFSDRSTDDGTIVAWLWDYGDGNTATTQNPTHSFPGAFEFMTGLTVTDDRGVTDTVYRTVTTNLIPSAGFSYTVDGLDVDFADESSDDNGTIVAWAWDFGDGTTSTEQDPGHGYAVGGDYTVSLTVTDDLGDSASAQMVVALARAPMAGFSHTAEGLSVSFTDESADTDGTLVEWYWQFGDGSSSNAANPTHTYAAPGSYPVSLTVTDDDGATATSQRDITVTGESEPPDADCTCRAGASPSRTPPTWPVICALLGLAVMLRRRSC